MGQADVPDTFNRFWRISLTDYGYRDEIVEFLGYLPDGRCHIRFVRGRVEGACSPHSLFPVALHPLGILSATGAVEPYGSPQEFDPEFGWPVFYIR